MIHIKLVDGCTITADQFGNVVAGDPYYKGCTIFPECIKEGHSIDLRSPKSTKVVINATAKVASIDYRPEEFTDPDQKAKLKKLLLDNLYRKGAYLRVKAKKKKKRIVELQADLLEVGKQAGEVSDEIQKLRQW